jgi:hypothetical protein
MHSNSTHPTTSSHFSGRLNPSNRTELGLFGHESPSDHHTRVHLTTYVHAHVGCDPVTTCASTGVWLLIFLQLQRPCFVTEGKNTPPHRNAHKIVPQMGIVHSAMLAGYAVGQLPAGWLSDKCGGER